MLKVHSIACKMQSPFFPDETKCKLAGPSSDGKSVDLNISIIVLNFCIKFHLIILQEELDSSHDEECRLDEEIR